MSLEGQNDRLVGDKYGGPGYVPNIGHRSPFYPQVDPTGAEVPDQQFPEHQGQRAGGGDAMGAGNDPTSENGYEEKLVKLTLVDEDTCEETEGMVTIYLREDSCGIESSSSSGSSSGSSGSSGSSESVSIGSSGSSKDTAIVKASWLKSKFTALFCMEMPEVRFHDITRFAVTGRITRFPIDRRMLEVCEDGTLEVCGLVPDRAAVVGATVEGGDIVLRSSFFPWRRPRKVVAELSGIREDFLDVRFPPRTEKQFNFNNDFIDSAYPADEIPKD